MQCILRPSPHTLLFTHSSTRRNNLRESSVATALPPPSSAAGASADGLVPLVAGKLFTCTECGKCCTGQGEVWANNAEVDAMTKFLGLRPSHFESKYTKSYSRRPGWHMIKRMQGTGNCVFLKDNKCSVYGARPMQCATYPWWPDLMSDRAWQAEAASVCEGINHEDAKEVDSAAAARQLLASSEYFVEFQASMLARSARKGK